MSQPQSELPAALAGQEREDDRGQDTETLVHRMPSGGESPQYGHSLSTLAGTGIFLQ